MSVIGVSLGNCLQYIVSVSIGIDFRSSPIKNIIKNNLSNILADICCSPLGIFSRGASASSARNHSELSRTEVFNTINGHIGVGDIRGT